MSKKISGIECNLAEIFGKGYEYHIPSYQRPYSWTIDQAEELFDDLYDFHKNGEDEGYFLGSIVLIKKEGDPKADVIDGQQRLTTLTILLATLACKLPKDSKIQHYIMESGNEFEGREPQVRLFLRDRDQVFFKKYVQDLQFDELLSLDAASLENEAQVNVQTNSRYFVDRLNKEFEENVEAVTEFVKFLVTRCFIVVVSTPNQQTAFRVFSVMNSRGLDLQPTDIIKADVMGAIPECERDEYSRRWEDMESSLDRDGFNDLFTFIRMIFAKEKAQRGLLEEFKKYVVEKVGAPKQLVEEILEPYAEVLAIVKKSEYRAVSDATEINNYLHWLNRLDNSDWIPVAIQFMRQKRNNPEYVKWFFKKLERLAAYLHVCAKNINERIRRYAEVIKALENPHDLESPVLGIDLTAEEIEEMLEALSGNVYQLTPRRRSYLILRLDSFRSDLAASYDASLLTIEHVLPQTVEEGSEWEKLWPEEDKRLEWVHKIANLVPLNTYRNSKAQNFDFKRKKSAYFKGEDNLSSYVLTTEVLNTESWDEQHLQKRQRDLLDVMKKHWELEAIVVEGSGNSTTSNS